MRTFNTLGHCFSGLIWVSSKTLNLLDCSSTYTEFQNNLCGFIAAMIENLQKLKKNSLEKAILRPLNATSCSRESINKQT